MLYVDKLGIEFLLLVAKGFALCQLVSQRFQVLFHSPLGGLFTFPSRYLSTIGQFEYLALGRGRPRFPQDFACPAVLRNLPSQLRISCTRLSLSLVNYSTLFHYPLLYCIGSPTTTSHSVRENPNYQASNLKQIQNSKSQYSKHIYKLFGI